MKGKNSPFCTDENMLRKVRYKYHFNTLAIFIVFFL